MSFLDGLSNGPLGMFTPSGPKGPEYKTTELDPKTKELIHGMAQRASASEGEIAAKMNEGVEQAGQQANMSNQDMATEIASGRASNSNQLAAIRNRYNQYAQKDITRLTEKNSINAPLYKSDMLQRAAMAAQAKQNVAMKNYEGLVQAYNNSQMARAQLLSGIFSLGGILGGQAAANYQNRGSNSNNGQFQQLQQPQMGSQFGHQNQSYLGNYNLNGNQGSTYDSALGNYNFNGGY